MQPFREDELHFRFFESADIYETYLLHFSNLIQERENQRRNFAEAIRHRKEWAQTQR